MHRPQRLQADTYDVSAEPLKKKRRKNVEKKKMTEERRFRIVVRVCEE